MVLFEACCLNDLKQRINAAVTNFKAATQQSKTVTWKKKLVRKYAKKNI